MSYNKNITEQLVRFLYRFYKKIEVKNIDELSTEEYRKKLNEKFKLKSDFDFEIIQSCYWLIEDTESAINEFLHYGVQGPTRNAKNLGEKYLRLYGILNAVYLQKSVIIQLYEIFKIPNKSDISKKFNSLEIIKVRNKVASHTVDYNENGVKDYFRITQSSLEGKFYNGKIHIQGKVNDETFDLEQIILDFKEHFNFELLKICKDINKKFFVEGSNIRKKLNLTLEEISELMEGTLVLYNVDNEPIYTTSDNSYIEEE